MSLTALVAIYGFSRWAAQIEQTATLPQVAVILSAMAVMAASTVVLFMAGAGRFHLAIHGLLGAGVLAASAAARMSFISIGGSALLLLVPLVYALSVSWPDHSHAGPVEARL